MTSIKPCFISIIMLLLLLPAINYGQITPKSLNPISKSNKPGSFPENPAPAVQYNKETRTLNWTPIRKVSYTEEITEHYLYFEGATYSEKSRHLPVYSEKIALSRDPEGFKSVITNPVFEDLTESGITNIKELAMLGSEIELQTQLNYHRKIPYGILSFIPIRKNPVTGNYEKLVSFGIKTTPYGKAAAKKFNAATQYAANSVLSTGEWYKLAVSQDGVYRITFSFLQGLGIDAASINPQNIRIYGNGGGMLPISNSTFRYDDLVENAIEVAGAGDGSFDGNDYILFYGQSPNRWSYSTDNRYHHNLHLYSDKTYYFLTVNGGTGIPKRISLQPSGGTENTSVTEFDDYAFHEQESENLLLSGKDWLGEKFDILNSYNFSFSFPNIVSPAYIKVAVAGQAISPATGSFTVDLPSTSFSINTGSVTGDYLNTIVNLVNSETTFSAGSSNINITVSYTTGVSSVGWLDYLELNVRRQFILSGNQMLFRDALSVGSGNIAKFMLNGASSSVRIWEVTDPATAKEQQTTLSGSTMEFTLPADSLREFIAFNGNSYLTPLASGKVAYQNIHGTLGQPDMVIITHPDFLNEANTLASFHQSNDGLDVAVVQTYQVYNEFSSGAQDVTAIKDLMRMLYNRASDSTEMPRYLLLFGGGSYDHKNRLSNNTNFIPTYQSANSYDPVSTYTSDDYFGLLDDSEGESSSSDVDIGIGRLPVKSLQEAQAALNKILHYHTPVTMKNWRNVVCFVADDEDGNIHTNDADALATLVDTTYNDYDIDKIYFDAYPQQSTPGGQRYPDATEAINRRMKNGALTLNYTGHGGELGWAHERVLENSDINSWTNLDNMPMFITATCTFSRFDDPSRTSAGVNAFLNPNGGAIALLSTVRVVYSGANKTLTTNFYTTVFEPISGEMPRLGDVTMLTKNKTYNGVNSRKFVLLGDPAMRLAYPQHYVLTDSINQQPVMGISDTLKALSKVIISGHIENNKGGKYSGFNGTVYPTVFDKASTITTLGNDPGSPVITFTLQKNALFRGKASIVNGDFSFTFVVPKDIAYQPGFGRISYYAENGITDASGPYENFIIGGSSSNIETDGTGPQVELYLNDTNFVSGGLTDENPVLLAFMSDEHGINTTGNGIGHDIAALLDEDSNNPIVLNEEYEADRDNYKRGSVAYPFSGLSEGTHKLSLKVWDVYNNSTQVFTDFVVSKSAELALSHVLNYPNPFTTNTEFWFEHNRPGDLLEVQIQVFTISGRLIKTINTNVITQGFRPDPRQWPDLQWDGRDDFGDKIGRGVYVYHLRVRSSDGNPADQFEKLVILN